MNSRVLLPKYQLDADLSSCPSTESSDKVDDLDQKNLPLALFTVC